MELNEEIGMHRTGKSHFERFRAAVAAEDDDRAEALVALLTPADAPALGRMAAQDGHQRWWAIRALAAVGDPSHLPLFLACLDDPQSDMRALGLMALAALAQRFPEAVAPHLEAMTALLADPDGLVRQAAVDALAQCGDAAVPVLAAALENPHDGVRVRAARALQRIGSMATAPHLYRHLDDPNPVVRHYAYEALDRLGLLNNVLLLR